MSLITELKDKYAALEPRERSILNYGAIIVLILIIFNGVYRPLANKQASLSEANVSDMELLIWMKQSAAQIKSSGGNAQETRRRGRNLNQILNSTSGVSQIAISRSQPRDNQQHQIWLDEVEFNQLLRWLSELQNDYGVFVSNLNLSSSPKTGYVRANITFQDSSAGG